MTSQVAASQEELELSPTVTSQLAPSWQSTSQLDPQLPVQRVIAPQVMLVLSPAGIVQANPEVQVAPVADTTQPGPGHTESTRPPSAGVVSEPQAPRKANERATSGKAKRRRVVIGPPRHESPSGPRVINAARGLAVDRAEARYGRLMKGAPDVIAKLDELLTHELTSADLYLYFAGQLGRQGYAKLHARLAHEAEDELLHAKRLVDRILLLEGEPDVLSRAKRPAPSDPKGILEASLAYELEVATLLNEAIRVCDDEGDAGSRKILEDLLRDTEDDHIDWLEAQLHQIGEVGLELYLGEQL